MNEVVNSERNWMRSEKSSRRNLKKTTQGGIKRSRSRKKEYLKFWVKKKSGDKKRQESLNILKDKSFFLPQVKYLNISTMALADLGM